MAAGSEITPFLAYNNSRNSYSEFNGEFTKVSTANSRLNRPIAILTCVISFLSLAIFGLLIASYVLLHIGPFEQFSFTPWVPKQPFEIYPFVLLFANFLLTAPTIFFQIPSLINAAVHVAMSIVVLVFSAGIIEHGWPDSNFCRRWSSGPDFETLPGTTECIKARDDLRTMMGISASVSMVIVILILATLVLRLVALFKDKAWEGRQLGILQGSEWNPNGFTVQFKLSILPNERPDPTVQPTKPIKLSSNTDKGPLIET